MVETERVTRAIDRIVFFCTLLILLVVGCFTVPRLFGFVPFTVQSASMEPEIPTGSVVFVNENDKDVEVGDVITFGLSTGESTGVYVTHRVHALKDGLVQTKGDANDNTDGFLETEAIVGTVIFHVPKVGFLLNTLNTGHGYAILAALILFVNVISLILRTLCSKRKEKSSIGGTSIEEKPKSKKTKEREAEKRKVKKAEPMEMTPEMIRSQIKIKRREEHEE